MEPQLWACNFKRAQPFECSKPRLGALLSFQMRGCTMLYHVA